MTRSGQCNTKKRKRPRSEFDELEEFGNGGEFDRSIDNPINENSYGWEESKEVDRIEGEAEIKDK